MPKLVAGRIRQPRRVKQGPHVALEKLLRHCSLLLIRRRPLTVVIPEHVAPIAVENSQKVLADFNWDRVVNLLQVSPFGCLLTGLQLDSEMILILVNLRPLQAASINHGKPGVTHDLHKRTHLQLGFLGPSTLGDGFQDARVLLGGEAGDLLNLSLDALPRLCRVVGQLARRLKVSEERFHAGLIVAQRVGSLEIVGPRPRRHVRKVDVIQELESGSLCECLHAVHGLLQLGEGRRFQPVVLFSCHEEPDGFLNGGSRLSRVHLWRAPG